MPMMMLTQKLWVKIRDKCHWLPLEIWYGKTRQNKSRWHYVTQYITTKHSVIPYTTLHYTTLHCTTLHCNTLHYNTQNNTTLHYTTPQYTTLHYTTLHCTTPHHTTPHCTTPHHTHLGIWTCTVYPWDNLKLWIQSSLLLRDIKGELSILWLVDIGQLLVSYVALLPSRLHLGG